MLLIPLDLIIPWKTIHERYSLESTGIVNHDISDGQWKLIFRTGGIEIAVIDINPDFFILFKNEDNIGNPIRVLLFPYETTCDKFMNFSFNSLHDIGAKSSLLLFHWLDFGLIVQSMHGYLRIKSGHIFVFSYNDINILSYECYQFFFLCKW